MERAWHRAPPNHLARPGRACVSGGSAKRDRGTVPETEEGTQMPELLVDFITSLDGYASADGWPGWWGLEGPEYLSWLEESPERDYLVLMGHDLPPHARLHHERRARHGGAQSLLEGRLLEHAH